MWEQDWRYFREGYPLRVLRKTARRRGYGSIWAIPFIMLRKLLSNFSLIVLQHLHSRIPCSVRSNPDILRTVSKYSIGRLRSEPQRIKKERQLYQPRLPPFNSRSQHLSLSGLDLFSPAPPSLCLCLLSCRTRELYVQRWTCAIIPFRPNPLQPPSAWCSSPLHCLSRSTDVLMGGFLFSK